MSVDTDSYLNSIFSATRNSIISTSLGVGVYGFSRSLKKKKSVEIMKLLSTLLLFIFVFEFVKYQFNVQRFYGYT